jgi:hypothetical protein
MKDGKQTTFGVPLENWVKQAPYNLENQVPLERHRQDTRIHNMQLESYAQRVSWMMIVVNGW